MEILRCYAEVYVLAAQGLTMASASIDDAGRGQTLSHRLHRDLSNLAAHCDHLPMTKKSATALINLLNHPDRLLELEDPDHVIKCSIADIQNRLTDELALNLFFKLPQDRKRYFDDPLTGWNEVASRFPETIGNIEEMSKCFALSRYAAAVFHGLRAVESGLIHFGKFLDVKDTKSGWTAVTARLDVLLVKTKYPSLELKYQNSFGFLEQMNAVAQALKSAWRNKISHAQGSLTLMTEDFSPDVAEEIMLSSRSFMRRLATEMPQ